MLHPFIAFALRSASTSRVRAMAAVPTKTWDEPCRRRAAAPGRHLSICMLITDFDQRTGGIQAQSRRLLRELHHRGIGTCICTRNYHHLPRHEEQDGIHIRRSPAVHRSLAVVNSIIYLVDTLVWLALNRRQYDLLHCQQMFGAAIVGLLAKKLLRKPTLVRVTVSGAQGEVSSLRSMPFAALRLQFLRGVDHWVALTSEMRSEIGSLEVPTERVTIIPNSATLPGETNYGPGVRERYRASLRLTYPQIAVFSGRLSREKGLDTLLQAWKLLQPRHPDAHLLLLGEGGAYRNMEKELHALCRQLELQNVVHFLGHVGNVGEYLLSADLFVLPTRQEGMSNALVEAMAAGTAIVTTGISANRDLVHDGVNGLLVPPDDVEGLAAAISRLLADPLSAEHLGRSAREKAERELSVETMASRYLEIYERLLSRPASLP
jgi:glycosyltransferase involved in cell wall biosynthesis